MSKPRERSIIYAGWEVRAILAGRKVRTTVPVVPQPNANCFEFYEENGLWRTRARLPSAGVFATPLDIGRRCPFGVPGGRLIGKETWRARKIRQGQRLAILCEYFISPEIGREILFEGDNLPQIPKVRNCWWSPAIMPRWASRLPLDITSVAVGRVGEMSTADAYAEGATDTWPRDDLPYLSGAGGRAVLNNFEHLWDSRWPAYPFAENPWVWHIGHEVSKPGEGVGG